MPVRCPLILAALAFPAALAAQQPPPTAQQLFDSAAALEGKGDWAGARAAWQKLEDASVRNRRTRAVARLRKGTVLYQLGQPDAAVAALRAALADLPATDPTLRDDRYQAHLILGRVAESSLDYAGAARDYAVAETLTDAPDLKLAALAGVAATQTFLDPAAAGVALDRAEALLTPAKATPAVQAAIARRRALLFLNRGDFAGARKSAERAVKLLGGLTERVDLQDVAARGDAALAALLGGDAENARKYMAYTGAGRVPGGFDPGARMRPPFCGGEAGLKPDDAGVVEFSIGADGRITYAAPIYASGGPDKAIEFARAAREWSWTPEQVKELPAFFRNRARVEMRCSTAFERPSVSKFLEGDLAAWLAQKGAPLRDAEGADAALVSGQRAALSAADGTSNPAAAIGPLYQLATNAVVGREESNAFARRALALATAAGAPATARLALDLIVRRTEGAETWRDARLRARLRALAGDPSYAADPRARAAARLLLADAESNDRARAPLDAVANDAALPASDPLKVGALIRIASLDHADGDTAAARAAFARSGLSADQCALVDKEPRMLRASAGASSFPTEALRWGFEGWVQTEYDIAADGRTQSVRPVLSYPPFVFSDAGARVYRTARFEKTFRPDGGLGCGAQPGRVRFKLPGS